MAVTLYTDRDRTRRGMERLGDTLMEDAVVIIDTARRRGAQIRLIGGLAARSYATDLDFIDRDYSDIDLIGHSSEAVPLHGLLVEMGYEENRHIAQATAGAQLQYVRRTQPLGSRAHSLERPRLSVAANRSAATACHIDVFLDAVRMDHDVEMADRLTVDPYAISPADVLLTKLQIGRIAEKDVRDVIALVKDLPLSEDDDNASIDVLRVARVCAGDWGLGYDVTTNLALVVALLDDYPLSVTEHVRVRGHLHALTDVIAREKKTLRWRLRARFGTRLPWRRDVEERDGSPLVVRLPERTTLVACEACAHTVEVSQELADLPAAPLVCPACGSLDLESRPRESEEPAAA